jgi:hypothetical protein
MQNDDAEKESPTPEEQKAIWLEEIKSNAAITEYLNKFHPKSVEEFITSYVSLKHDWHTYGPNYLEESEQKSIKWIDIASAHLPIILQKKLFDVQCLWRAEQLDIPELKLCCEFRAWEENILNCPFIEPLTEDDIELYQSFLLQCPLDEGIYDNYIDWQDMDKLRKAFKDDPDSGNFPEWYEFFNIRRGTDTLMLLPDIRGQKEEFYIALCREERREINREKWEEEERNRDKRPSIATYKKEDLTAFVSRFEGGESKRLYDAYNYCRDHLNKKDILDWELRLMWDAEEPVPIQAHSDWKTAIKNAARTYERKKVAEALPQAWEQYRMNIDLGIGFPVTDPKTENWIVNMFKETILRGRVLNGEPEDLMF